MREDLLHVGGASIEASRWDNLDWPDLLAEAERLSIESHAIMSVIRDRALARALELAPIGSVWRIADDGRPLAGRLILVESGVLLGRINWGDGSFVAANPLRPGVYGRMNLPRSPAGDGWSLRRQLVSVDRLAERLPDRERKAP